MSFFNEDDIIKVYSTTCHLVNESTNTTSDAVLYSILSNSSIPTNLLKAQMNQMSTLVDSYRTYGINHYTLGLPTVEYSTSLVLNEQDVADAIAADIGNPYGVVLEYYYSTPLIPSIVIAPYLFSVRGWNPQTNKISILPSQYQKSSTSTFEGTVQSIEFNEEYTTATITYKIQDFRPVFIEHADGTSTPSRELRGEHFPTEVQPLPVGLGYGKDYFIACYHNLDSEGAPSEETCWWFYDISTKKYPALVPENSIDEENNLLPVVPVRYQNKSMSREDVRETDLFKTSQKLLKKIGLDFDQITEVLESNEYINDIDNAYIMFGVDLQTEEVSSIRYLAEYFDSLADKTTVDLFSLLKSNCLFGNITPYETAPQYNVTSYIFNIPDTLPAATDEVSWTSSDGTTASIKVTSNANFGLFEEDYGLNMSLLFSHIRSDICRGSIGEIGHAIKEFILGEEYQRPNVARGYHDDSTLILKVQIAKNAYKKITVKGLVHRSGVYKKHDYITPLSYIIKDSSNHSFIIPLHYNLSLTLPREIRNKLYQDSLLIWINAYKSISVEWYQTGFFTFIVLVVGMVISVYSGQYWIEGLLTAAQLGVTALILYLLETVVIAVAVSKILDYISEWVGPEAMVILSLAIIAIASFRGMGYLDNVILLDATLPSAMQLLNLSSMMLASATRVNAGFLEDLENEESSYEAEKETKLLILEDALELLDFPDVDSLNLLDAQTYSATLEQPVLNSPGEFYDISIHTCNPGVISLDAIPAFVDLSLTLPKQKLYSL